MIISGQELWLWQKRAQQQAIAAHLPPHDVHWLLRELAGLDSLTLHLETYKTRSQIELKISLSELERLWQLRLGDRVPLQHLTGQVSWRHFTLKVSPEVLIPRPETEILIDRVAEIVQQNPQLAEGHWVDLGTGSGAIALGLAECLPKAQIHAIDISAESLEIARKNAQNLNFAHRIQFHQGSWWQPLTALVGKISGMISNPPYIPSALIAELEQEVSQHEPHLALDGGNDGLDAIRHLVATAPDYLHSGGLWAIEMMDGQAEIVTHLLENQGNYQNIHIVPDLAKIERFAFAYCR
ncbi:peptide chain release factor N(5)-glutamine methyltransferase [Spirulina sp. 06S082]|uniref:peptide chain release factor N(5)-glutamine methyltransferase n=1 Tax=Spirulina sp. 06S082 TaxID=3110248 RepID=UPI002B21DAEB|nr:peptide chain release factor N(5)-glutamine methyltransferase [Spirulina sp. 06S082]MEA5471273.1 peptide chain release factor N(5)-glutamine methyltransferase [Spirulina sp. 06S082]